MQKEHFTRITADEINCLIYSYFVDSGMKHSAFTLNAEARLENSPFFRKHIRRGELVELLIKALLYVEVESHWNQSALSVGCKAGFSLLEPHVCSLTPSIPNTSASDTNQKPDGDAGSKRKSTSPTENGRNGKRARVEPEATQTEEPQTTKATRAATSAQVVKSTSPVHFLKSSSAEVRPVFVCTWNPVRRNLLAYGSKDSRATIYDLPDTLDNVESVDPAIVLEGLTTQERGDITCLNWSLDGNLLAVATCDANIRVFKHNGELYFDHPQHQEPMFALRFSTDAKYVASASLDGSSALWDIEEKKLVRVYKAHTDCVLNVSWVDNTHFLTAGADKDAYLYDVHKVSPVHRFNGHTGEVNMVSCNVSHTRVATCSDDRTVRIWDLASVLGDNAPGLTPAVVRLVGHQHSVIAHEWFPKGLQDGVELIATASFDGQSRLWDAVSGACLYAFNDGERPVFALGFSPSGMYLATGNGEGKLNVYNTKTGKLRYTWRSQKDHPGIFEIDWQQHEKKDRIALALEMGRLGLVDVTRIPELR